MIPAPAPDEQEVRRRQRSRSLLTAMLLGGFAILIFAITIAKMGLHR